MQMPKKNKLPAKIDAVIRSFGIADLRALSEENTNVIDGHAAVYDQKTDIGGYFYEVIERGAFDNTNFDDVLFCVNHDLRKIPLARSRRNNGNSTMQLSVDDKGLYIKAALDTDNNAEAKSLYSAVSRGDISGMSFMFYVEEERWANLDTDMPTRYISKIKTVREVSAVNFPAYDGTDINARDQAVLDNAAMALENARSSLDNGNDEQEALRLARLKFEKLY
jgi:HK97 family phage prohead protease